MSMEFTSEKLRRVVMTVAGVTASGVAVGFFNYSAFGMDPFQVLAHGLWNLTPIGYGTFYTIFSLLLFVFTLVMDRKKIGLGTVINMFLLGYITEFFSWLFATLFPGGGFFFRLIMLLIGITIMCLAASLYFTANMGVSVYDAIALCLSERTPIKFQYCRIGSLCCGRIYLRGPGRSGNGDHHVFHRAPDPCFPGDTGHSSSQGT